MSTNPLTTAGTTCPVCVASASSIALLNRADVAGRIEAALGSRGVGPLLPSELRIMRCDECGLEFAHPMREPGAAFYEWLTRSGFAYPRQRWEWAACRDVIAASAKEGGGEYRVLDVGSGDGTFLRMLSQVDGVHGIGVDHNMDVVTDCQAQGLDVVCGGLGDIRDRLLDGVDMVTLWHVVEHVGDPVGLLETTRGMLCSGGMLCFSVPLTPMSYEHAWPDPFNAPPHHLTRWSIRSLEALARRLGMRMRIELPEADPLLSRVLKCLALQAMPPFGVRGRWRKAIRLAGFLALRPWRLPIEVAHQARRTRHAGCVLPDVVLVCLEH